MADLSGALGTVTLTVLVTRAATGKTESYQLTGAAYLSEEEPQPTPLPEVEVEQPKQEQTSCL